MVLGVMTRQRDSLRRQLCPVAPQDLLQEGSAGLRLADVQDHLRPSGGPGRAGVGIGLGIRHRFRIGQAMRYQPRHLESWGKFGGVWRSSTCRVGSRLPRREQTDPNGSQAQRR